ncbi:peptidoglycan-binding domain-containing protein [Marmoricola sp. Leaf446]|uniref:peptidoglycan-binding domain-containing protein n=1 Tax=Marmoricola sp. Leaf446 TaxID=1736379 RepID=UPI0012E3DF01|nr:peptidoglycan-binding domain-containing protein [Marmoricola sp. Leaf446]
MGPASAYSACTNTAYRSTSPNFYYPVTSSGSSQCEAGIWLASTSYSGVKTLQSALNACYATGLSVDGHYGSRTKAAIEMVQRRHGITVDGGYGPQTRNAMRWPKYYQGRGIGCISFQQTVWGTV